MKYVIKSWDIKRRPTRSGLYISIKGRKSGILSFILALLGIDPTVSLEVYGNRIIYAEGSLFGYVKSFIPIANLSSVTHGLVRPIYTSFALFVVSVFLCVLFMKNNNSTAGLAALLIGLIVMILYYILNKNFSIFVHENAGLRYGFTFKASVIEGHRVDERAVDSVMRIITSLVENPGDKHSGKSSGNRPDGPAAPSSSRDPNPDGDEDDSGWDFDEDSEEDFDSDNLNEDFVAEEVDEFDSELDENASVAMEPIRSEEVSPPPKTKSPPVKKKPVATTKKKVTKKAVQKKSGPTARTARRRRRRP